MGPLSIHCFSMEQSNKYLVVLAIVTVLIGFYFRFESPVLLWIAFGIALTSVLSSFVAEKVAFLWEKFALVLGTVNSKILLTAIFYVFLVPVALLSRLFKKKDGLMLKRKKEGSYYHERNYSYKAEDLEQVF